MDWRASLLLMPLLAPHAVAEGLPTAADQCATLSWSDETSLPDGQLPVGAEYRGRIQFRTQDFCGPQVTSSCANGNRETRFIIVSGPEFGTGNFTPNPVIASTSGPVPGRQATATTTLRFRLNHTAPYAEPFTLRIRADCESDSGSAERTMKVGPFVAITGHSAGVRLSGTTATWTIEVRNVGLGPVSVEIETAPMSRPGQQVLWSHPGSVVVPYDPSLPDTMVKSFELKLEGYNRSANYSVELRPSSVQNSCCTGKPIILPLPIVTFSGSTSPAPGVAAVAGLLLALVLGRRRD